MLRAENYALQMLPSIGKNRKMLQNKSVFPFPVFYPPLRASEVRSEMQVAWHSESEGDFVLRFPANLLHKWGRFYSEISLVKYFS